MDGYFIGTILLFAGNYAPQYWASCEGQLMPIAQNEALYTIIGAQFGGDGRTNFALPDLRNAAPGGPNSVLHYIICVMGQYPNRTQ
jgi:microcystin-dependent protein